MRIGGREIVKRHVGVNYRPTYLEIGEQRVPSLATVSFTLRYVEARNEAGGV